MTKRIVRPSKFTYIESVQKLLAYAEMLPPEQRSEFKESVRRTSVLSKVDFRSMQKRNEFTDRTGDVYLECAVLSLEVPEVSNGR